MKLIIIAEVPHLECATGLMKLIEDILFSPLICLLAHALMVTNPP